MKLIGLIASIAVGFTIAQSAGATEYVTNGNFAQLSNGLGQLNYDGYTVANGWSTTHNYGYDFVMNKADVGSNGQYGNLSMWDAANGGTSSWNGMSPNGDNFVAMDGAYDVAPVQQMITGLTVGKSYTLSFIYAFAQQFGYNQDTVQHISTSFGGNTVFTSADYPLPQHGFSGWMTYTGQLTASSASEALSFLAYGNKPVPPFALFTDVSLVGAVPEPATWAMMLIGLGAIGVAARRRRTDLAVAYRPA